MEVFHLQKKTPWLLAAMLLVLSLALTAAAEDAQYLRLPGVAPSTTNISVNLPPENPAEAGINPITGEQWAGLYHPIMVQIDSSHDALPHWGVSSADIIYEMPLHQAGDTRSVALFMGNIPNIAGPVRSARVPMASLREMWGAAWVFYGTQEYWLAEETTVDVLDFVSQFNPDCMKGGRWVFPFFNGTDMQYYELFGRQSDGEHVAPHNATINLRGVEEYYNYEPVKHPFKFTDTGLDHGTSVTGITIDYRTQKPITKSSYVYDERTGLYTRYREDEQYYDGNNGLVCEYANVIILYSNVSWFNGNASRPVIRLIGQGTADIFQNGKWIRGMWVRGRAQGETNVNDPAQQASRLIFLDDTGNELEMKRGKTFVQIVDETKQIVSVTTSEQIAGATVQATPKPTNPPKATRTPPPTRPPRQAKSTPVPEQNQDSGDGEVEFGGF